MLSPHTYGQRQLWYIGQMRVFIHPKTCVRGYEHKVKHFSIHV